MSGNYFDVLGVSAARGRTFSAEEDGAPGSQPVVVVSDAFWRSRFAADPNLIGQTITLNGFPLTVIGIAARDFNGMILEEPTQLWVPALMHPQLAQSKFIENRNDRFLLLLGRVNTRLTQSQAEAGLDAGRAAGQRGEHAAGHDHQGFAVQRTTHPVRAGRPRHFASAQAVFLAVQTLDGRSWVGASDCLRERRGFVAGARSRAA